MEQALGAAIDKITQAGVAFALLILICYFLGKAVNVLYQRNQALADKFVDALNQNTAAMNNLCQQIERSQYVRKD